MLSFMPREPDPASLEALTREIRRAFQSLRAAADDLHRDLGITAAMRSVMEHLADGPPQTVPGIARAKNVTRQHIQQIANALVEAGLLDAIANPRHQSSPLLALSPRGMRTFALLRKRETVALNRLAKAMRGADIGAASDALRRLSSALGRTSR